MLQGASGVSLLGEDDGEHLLSVGLHVQWILDGKDFVSILGASYGYPFEEGDMFGRSLQFPVMMRTSLRVRLHHHRPSPKLLRPHLRMRNSFRARHPRRLRRVRVQLPARMMRIII